MGQGFAKDLMIAFLLKKYSHTMCFFNSEGFLQNLASCAINTIHIRICYMTPAPTLLFNCKYFILNFELHHVNPSFMQNHSSFSDVGFAFISCSVLVVSQASSSHFNRKENCQVASTINSQASFILK